MPMRATLIIEDSLLEQARELSGIQEKAALLHAGLRALIEREASLRLAALSGSEPQLRPIPRPRSELK